MRRKLAHRGRAPHVAPLQFRSVAPKRPTDVDDPVLRLILERYASGSMPGARSDGRIVAAVIEGGGMAGTVTGGELSAFEAMGLTPTIDFFIGASIGVTNGMCTAAGRAGDTAILYITAAQSGVLNLRRALRLQPPFQLDTLFGLMRRNHPHAASMRSGAPDLLAVLTRADDGTLEVIGDLGDPEDALAAAQASCQIPLMAGMAFPFRGGQYFDGGLQQSIPYQAAFDAGATDLLVFRTRRAGYRHRKIGAVERRLTSWCLRLGNVSDAVTDLVVRRDERYNAEAEALLAPAGLPGNVTQLAPPDGTEPVSMTELRPERLRDAIYLGANTVYDALGRVLQRWRHGCARSAATSSTSVVGRRAARRGAGVGTADLAAARDVRASPEGR
jgi:predicted patatin/cPLA2 family phospholipase